MHAQAFIKRGAAYRALIGPDIPRLPAPLSAPRSARAGFPVPEPMTIPGAVQVEALLLRHLFLPRSRACESLPEVLSAGVGITVSRCQSSLPRYRKSSPGGLPRRCRAPRASSTRRSTERRGTKGLLSLPLCRPVALSLSLALISLSLFLLECPRLRAFFHASAILGRYQPVALSPPPPVADNRGLPSAVSLLSSRLSYMPSYISLDTEPLARRRCCLLATPSPFPRSSRRVLPPPPPPPPSLLLADCVPCRGDLSPFCLRAVHPVAALSVVVYFASSLIPFFSGYYIRVQPRL